MYGPDRGVEERERTRGEEEGSSPRAAVQWRTLTGLNPGSGVAADRLAPWLARDGGDE